MVHPAQLRRQGRRFVPWLSVLFLPLLLLPTALASPGEQPWRADVPTSTSCTGGIAVWANSQNGKKIVEWSSSRSSISGGLHSNGDILIEGADNVINGVVEYNTTFTDAGQNNQYDSLNQAAPSPRPLTYAMADYRPGGAAASEAILAGQYHLVLGNLEVKAPEELSDGLYYVMGDIKLQGDHLRRSVTLVAEGKIELKGVGQELIAYTDGLLLFANTNKGHDGVKLDGQQSLYQGIIYEPNGRIELAGSLNRFDGSLFANTVKLKGNELAITFSERFCPGATATLPPPTSPPTDTVTATPPPTETATVTTTPSPTDPATSTPLPSPSETPVTQPTATETASATDTPTTLPGETATGTAPTPVVPTETTTPMATETEAPVAATPTPGSFLQVTMVDYLWQDADADGEVSTGDTLFYELKIVNNSPTLVAELLVQGRPDRATTLRPGTVKTELGTVLTGNQPGDAEVVVAVGSLESGQQVKLGWQVLIQQELAVQQIANQAVITFRGPATGRGERLSTVSDDPDTPAQRDATVTLLKGGYFVIHLPWIEHCCPAR